MYWLNWYNRIIKYLWRLKSLLFLDASYVEFVQSKRHLLLPKQHYLISTHSQQWIICSKKEVPNLSLKIFVKSCRIWRLRFLIKTVIKLTVFSSHIGFGLLRIFDNKALYIITPWFIWTSVLVVIVAIFWPPYILQVPFMFGNILRNYTIYWEYCPHWWLLQRTNADWI